MGAQRGAYFTEVGWQAVIAGDENEGGLPLGKMEGRMLQGALGGRGGGQCATGPVGSCKCCLTSLVCAWWLWTYMEEQQGHEHRSALQPFIDSGVLKLPGFPPPCLGPPVPLPQGSSHQTTGDCEATAVYSLEVPHGYPAVDVYTVMERLPPPPFQRHTWCHSTHLSTMRFVLSLVPLSRPSPPPLPPSLVTYPRGSVPYPRSL